MVTLAPSWSILAVCADESASVCEQRPKGSRPSEPPPLVVCVGAPVRGFLNGCRARDVSVLGGRGVYLAVVLVVSGFRGALSRHPVAREPLPVMDTV